MNAVREEDSQIINTPDPGSPKIENIVEAIDPPSLQPAVTKAPQTKRIKLENAGDEPLDMTHFPNEVLPDDCEVFGKSVAAQLRQMAKPQKILAQRLISEVCFRGQIQVLSVGTTMGNQPTPFFQQVPQPVLPSYACKMLNIVNNRPSEYFVPHHFFANTKQPSAYPSHTVGSAAYQGCGNVPHPEIAGPTNLSHNSPNDALP